MTLWFCVLVLAINLGLLTGSAFAGDFCFNSTSPPNPAPPTNPDILVIAQKFSVPGKGKCKAIIGWDTGYSNQTIPRPASGTACLNSAGTRLDVGFVIHLHPHVQMGEEIFVTMILPYPSLKDGQVLLHRSSQTPGWSLNLFRTDGVAGPCGFNFSIP